MVAGLASAVLAFSRVKAMASAAEHCPQDGKCGVEVTPIGTWLETGPFQPVADSDDACRAAAWCTAISSPNESESHPLLLGVRNPPVGGQPEGCRVPCSTGGRCSAVDGECRAKTETDCAFTEACVLWGHCSAVDGSCVSARDEDCAASRACRVLGRCHALGGACRSADHLALPEEEYAVMTGEGVPTTLRSGSEIRDEIQRCRGLHECNADGRCDVSATGECVVGSDEDCRSASACTARGACRRWTDNQSAECSASCADTTFCKQHGRCTPMTAGLCGSGQARDCERSEACRLDGRCALIDGVCQATAEICAKWDGCSFDGRCSVVAGECRLTQGSCGQTIPCAKLGACSASTEFEGCGVGSHTDCAQSEVCGKYGWCRAVGVGYWPMSTSRWFCFSEVKR